MTLPALFLASLPFAYFMLISSLTPGPNNLMLAASGMNFGIRRTVPHMAGVAIGFTSLMFLCAFGVGTLYHAYPRAHVVLNVFCAAYILYLAWKIATAGKPDALVPDVQALDAQALDAGPHDINAARPMTFVQAFLFQYINPKAWVMALASTSTLLPHTTITQQSLVIVMMGLLISAPCVCIWAGFGRAIATVFTSERSHHIINIILAVLLVATLPMMML